MAQGATSESHISQNIQGTTPEPHLSAGRQGATPEPNLYAGRQDATSEYQQISQNIPRTQEKTAQPTQVHPQTINQNQQNTNAQDTTQDVQKLLVNLSQAFCKLIAIQAMAIDSEIKQGMVRKTLTEMFPTILTEQMLAPQDPQQEAMDHSTITIIEGSLPLDTTQFKKANTGSIPKKMVSTTVKPENWLDLANPTISHP